MCYYNLVLAFQLTIKKKIKQDSMEKWLTPLPPRLPYNIEQSREHILCDLNSSKSIDLFYGS